jgi:hypothetical protein
LNEVIEEVAELFGGALEDAGMHDARVILEDGNPGLMAKVMFPRGQNGQNLRGDAASTDSSDTRRAIHRAASEVR